MRSDRVGHGRDDRPDRRRLSHDSSGSTIRERSSREHDGHVRFLLRLLGRPPARDQWNSRKASRGGHRPAFLFARAWK
jgi:hypothetical protein